MNKVKVITDSCADLSAEQLERYGIDYARMSTVNDGVESPALLTWSKEEAHALYETIRSGKRITTAQVSISEFTDIFTKYLDEGFDIVYIACSSKQSGSVNTGYVTARNILENYPNSKIFCIDSLNASMGEGMLAIKAAEMAADGIGAEEINKRITAICKNVQQFVTVNTLEHLKKAGRVSASSAFFGNLVGIKPILISDVNGTQTAYKKIRGRQASLRAIVTMLKENLIDSENQTIYIAHADCTPEEVDALVSMVKSEIPCKDISVGYIGPIIGASVGPDTIGVWGFGKPVTFAAE